MLFKKLLLRRTVLSLTLGLLFFGSLFLVQDSFTQAGDVQNIVAFVDVEALFQVHPQREMAEFRLQQQAAEFQEEMEEEAKDRSAEEQQEIMHYYQEKLQQYEQDLVADILEEITEMVALVAEQKKIEVVLESSQLLYGGLDLTPAVLDYMEENQ